MSSELEFIKKNITSTDNDIEKQAKRKGDGEALKKSLEEKLELHNQTIEKRQIDIGIIKKNLEHERSRNHDLITTKVDLNIQKKDIEFEVRHKRDQLVLIQKEYENMKRLYKKKIGVYDSETSLVPRYELQLKDEELRMGHARDTFNKNKENVVSLKDERELLIARFLQQEDLEKNKRKVII